MNSSLTDSIFISSLSILSVRTDSAYSKYLTISANVSDLSWIYGNVSYLFDTWWSLVSMWLFGWFNSSCLVNYKIKVISKRFKRGK